MLGKSMIAAVAGVLLFLGAASPTAWAQGVGTGSPTDTSHVLQPVVSFPEWPMYWNATIGTGDLPVPVALDPTGPAWGKHFQTLDNSPIDVYNGILSLNETLTVSGSEAWTGWHAEFITPGFIWLDTPPYSALAILANGSLLPLTYGITGAGIDATFAPLVPGTRVELFLKFAWPDTTAFTGSIDMRQYPVPEPLSLLGFTFFFLILGKRR